MRNIRRRAVAVASAALLAVAAMTGAAEARAAGGSWQGCPYGAVCVYGQDVNPWANPHPSHVYWSYGAHNLSNQYGDHFILNNQSGGATVRLCKGYNGVNCHRFLDAQYADSVDLTSYNSITLNRL
ncbi:hypothetical protein [Streptomyces flavofungini]|uniref:hypothetical protein n=1 Tax=Streptomyces flavofungini TaxID=68200 RepID=UPI0034E00B42